MSLNVSLTVFVLCAYARRVIHRADQLCSCDKRAIQDHISLCVMPVAVLAHLSVWANGVHQRQSVDLALEVHDCLRVACLDVCQLRVAAQGKAVC
jgi:hypothetical protein